MEKAKDMVAERTKFQPVRCPPAPRVIPSGGAATEISRRPNDGKTRLPGFSLTKYYLDAVTENGEYFIGYSAKLGFKHLALRYAELLHSPGLGGLKPGPVFSNVRGPVSDRHGLNWRQSKLGFDGHWAPLAPPSQKRLHATSEGYVDWECLQPGAKVTLKTETGRIVEGYGYCEHLTLTIPPWRLGLKELIWGRFVSATQSAAWIEWRGDNALRFVLWNGAPVEFAAISGSRVVTNDFTISVTPFRTLRQGCLGPNILSKAPTVFRLAPTAMLNVHETKRLGYGTLETADGRQEKGWVIHEKVIWPD